MKIIKFAGRAIAILCVFISAQLGADNNPVDEQWWPSEFGKDDQAGATNYITPSKRVRSGTIGSSWGSCNPRNAVSRTHAVIPGPHLHLVDPWRGYANSQSAVVGR